MIHYMPLSRLPDELVFPEDLQQRVWYDESQQRLAFDGFMSKSTFDRLEALCDDYEYRRAMEDLFRVAVPENRPQRTGQRARLWLAAGVVLVLTAGAVGVYRLVLHEPRSDVELSQPQDVNPPPRLTNNEHQLTDKN